MTGPRVLILDIETSPILAHVWKIWDENVGLNQIDTDWHVLSWAARWHGDPEGKIICASQRHAKDITNDKKLLGGIWKLLDEADIVVTHNGVNFDIRKLNARFILNGMKPPSNFKNIDTKIIASKKFGFTSNKLEYLTDRLCVKHKKLKHEKYSGFELWAECLTGNQEAWDVMVEYNIEDVLALEELFELLIPWDNVINFGLYTEGEEPLCSCGSTDFEKRGYHYTSSGKFQRYKCRECGAWSRDKTNLLSKGKTKKLRHNAG